MYDINSWKWREPSRQPQPVAVSSDSGASPCSAAAATAVGIVADDRAVRHSLVMLLRSAGFSVRGYCSAPDFLAAAASARESCLVIDHHLPGGTDAVALLERLAAMYVSIPAIVVSEFSDPPFHRRATAAGAVALLTKPLIDDAILVAVAAAVRQTSGQA